MPIDISWYIPSRILHIHVYDKAGTEEIQQLGIEIRGYLLDGNAPIHILLDDSKALPPPISIKHLKSILDMTQQPSEKIGWVVGVGDTNPIAKIVIPAFLKIVKIKYLRLETIDKAVNFLKKQDLSLNTSETP